MVKQGPTLEEWLADQPRQERIRMLVERDVRRYEREAARSQGSGRAFAILGALSPIIDGLLMAVVAVTAVLVIFG